MEQEAYNYSVDMGTYRYVVVVVQVPSDRKMPKGYIVKTYMYNRAGVEMVRGQRK